MLSTDAGHSLIKKRKGEVNVVKMRIGKVGPLLSGPSEIETHYDTPLEFMVWNSLSLLRFARQCHAFN